MRKQPLRRAGGTNGAFLPVVFLLKSPLIEGMSDRQNFEMSIQGAEKYNKDYLDIPP